MEELKNPPLPEDLVHLWRWFSELFVGEVLTFSEISSWASLTGENPTPQESRWLRTMSVTWIKEIDG